MPCMTVKLQRPLLVGGAALTLAIWVMDILNHLLGQWGIYVLFLAGAGAIGGWFQLQSRPSLNLPQLPPVMDWTSVKQALTEAEKVISQLSTEIANPQEPGSTQAQPHVSQFQVQVNQLATDMHRQQIRIAVMGSKGSGKTALMQQLQAAWGSDFTWELQLQETPAFAATGTGLAGELIAQQQAIAADLVLFLVTGDITDSEFHMLKQLAGIRRTLLVFNKQDQYLPEIQQEIWQQLQKRVQGILAAKDMVTVAAAPSPLKVRQHQPDGTVKEWLEDRQPDISPLSERLTTIMQQEAQQLVLTSSFSYAQALREQAKTVLNDVRRTRAIPVVEQFQWLSAGAAFASPLPAMDVVATVAINAQMMLDLGTIYQQKFSLQQAQKAATTLASLMLKLGLVELSTQAIANLLKTNAITYVAGGCIQGISAAYLTRVVGLSLIEYFHTQDPNLTMTEASPLAIERLSQIIQRVFQQNQQTSFLQSFVKQAIERFSSTLSSPSVATPNPVLPSSTVTPFKLDLPAEAVYISRSSNPEPAILEQNGTSVPLAVPTVSNLESTTHPSV